MSTETTTTRDLAAAARALREHYMSQTTTPSQHVAEVKHASSVAEQAADVATAVNRTNAETLLGNNPLAEQDAIAALGLELRGPKDESPHWSSAQVAGVIEMHAARLDGIKLAGMAYDIRVAAAKIRELQNIINSASPGSIGERTRQKFLADGVEP